MLCQECKERAATVHYTKVVNNQKTEYHLCEQCARQMGDLDLSFGFNPGFSIHSLLAGLLDMGTGKGSADVPSAQTIKCPACGLSYAQFSQSGRLGCGECYQAFDRQLDPLLRRIQGTTKHTGKIPERTGGVVKVEQQIRRLSAELQQAVDQEEFEKAAQLRDQIRELRQELEQTEGGKE
ncbi:MAG: UvrB/UvrC motif-containing protein [Bacillota bacterium]|jgi:protein arginine kinase activator